MRAWHIRMRTKRTATSDTEPGSDRFGGSRERIVLFLSIALGSAVTQLTVWISYAKAAYECPAPLADRRLSRLLKWR